MPENSLCLTWLGGVRGLAVDPWVLGTGNCVCGHDPHLLRRHFTKVQTWNTPVHTGLRSRLRTATSRAMPRTSRVLAGSMMASIQSRAAA